MYVVSNFFPQPRMFGEGAIEYDPLIYKHEKQHPKEKIEYGKYLQNSSQKPAGEGRKEKGEEGKRRDDAEDNRQMMMSTPKCQHGGEEEVRGLVVNLKDRITRLATFHISSRTCRGAAKDRESRR